jgi:hypothetical protein
MDEKVRVTKVRLTRGASRLDTQVQIWDADGLLHRDSEAWLTEDRPTLQIRRKNDLIGEMVL